MDMFKLICMLCLVIVTPSTFAGNSKQLSIDLLYFDYEEFDVTGFSLNHESGFIPGLATRLNHEQHSFEASIHNGTVDYDGYTQSLTPHQTDTKQTLINLSYRYHILLNEIDDQNKYFLGVSYKYWFRDIQPNNGVNGLEETYTWFTVEAGIQSVIFSKQNHALLLELGLLHTLNGTISIDLENSGFGSPELDLGNKPGIKGGLKFQYKTSQVQMIEIGVDYSHWQFGRSNSEILSNGFQTITITEPESKSNHTLFYVGLNQQF